MFVHPQFDPIAISLGPVAVRWYGLMYLLAFILFVVLGRIHARRRPELGWDAQQIDDLLFYGVLGVILGGRLGYVLFYKPLYYLSHPAEIIAVWQGGMAFHGGFLGVLVAMWLFGRKTDRPWLAVTDFIAPLVPLGLAAGRLGNFINGELWGRAADASLATSSAHAPSLTPDALPAVIVPPLLTTPFSAASASSVTSGRACSSRTNRLGSPFCCAISTARISSAKRPAASAAAQRCWLRHANAS